MTERVRIVHPRTEAASRVPVPPAVRATSGDTDVDDVSIRSLIRGQARIAALVTAATGVLLGGLATLGAFWPASGRTKLVPWIVLGVLVYPLLIALAWVAVRQSERNEDAFRDVTTRR
jgi:fatty acid desaturase